VSDNSSPDPPNPLLRIGPFSRASSLSVKALRAYHESGLLVPAEVDPTTGYRSYSVAQLADATIIRRLRELDVPLESIRQVLVARDPEVTAKVLAAHGAVLEQRVAAMQRAIDELSAGLETPGVHTPVHRRTEPAHVVLTVAGTVTEAEWAPFMQRTFALLADAVATSGAVRAGPMGACYPTLLDDDAQDVTAFVPVTGAPLVGATLAVTGVRVGDLPARDVAVLVHRGSYDTLPDTYRRLGAWVAANATPADEPVRELYLVGPGDTDDTDAFRTDVCWPLQEERT
jgi:DNA-binding transcriptional MerR regulator